MQARVHTYIPERKELSESEKGGGVEKESEIKREKDKRR
jgi:hypothetical protein